MEYVDAKGNSLGTRWSLRRPHFEFGKAPEDSLHLLFDSISFLPYPCSIAKTDVLRKAEIDKSMIMLLDVSLWANLIIDGAKNRPDSRACCQLQNPRKADFRRKKRIAIGEEILF